MKTKISQVEKKRIERALNKEHILRITGISEFEYNENVFETGVNYAIWSNEGDDNDMVAELLTYESYWHWWKNMYCLRDSEWINNKCLDMAVSDFQKGKNKIDYKYIHSIEGVLYSDDGVIYENAYCCFVDKWTGIVIKENNKIKVK